MKVLLACTTAAGGAAYIGEGLYLGKFLSANNFVGQNGVPVSQEV